MAMKPTSEHEDNVDLLQYRRRKPPEIYKVLNLVDGSQFRYTRSQLRIPPRITDSLNFC